MLTHETQSRREACVFSFSRLILIIIIIILIIIIIIIIYGIYIVLYPDAQSALQHFVGDFARLLI